jgi:hypothetical protein
MAHQKTIQQAEGNELTDDQKTVIELQSRLAEIEENHQWQVRSLESDVTSMYKSLEEKIEWLMRDLTRDLESLRKHKDGDDNYLGVNSLGLIQGLGTDINREVALLAAKKKELQTLKRVMR